MLNGDASELLKIDVIRRPNAGVSRDDDVSTFFEFPTPIHYVTLTDALGRRSRVIAEDLARLPHYDEMALRRDLFMRKFPCFVQFVGPVDEETTSHDINSSLPDFVVVSKEENVKLKRLNEELMKYYASVETEDYFYPRRGQVVVGGDALGFVMRYLLLRDVSFGDELAQVLSVDYGYPDAIPASSLRRLPTEGFLVDFPIQSLRCRLLDAPPSGTEESDAILSILENDGCDPHVVVSCEIDHIADGVYYVHVFVDEF